MSKILILTTTLLLITTATIVESNSSEESRSELEELQDIFSGRGDRVKYFIRAVIEKANDKCRDAEIDVDVVTNEIISRLQTILKQSNNQTICGLIQNKFAWLVEPLREKFIKCTNFLPGAPEFAINLILSVSNTICKIEGHQIFELLNPCLDALIAKECFSYPEYGEKVGGRLEFCNYYNNKRPCFKKYLKGCKVSETQDSFLTLYDDAMKKLC